jgi:hypothetical protein
MKSQISMSTWAKNRRRIWRRRHVAADPMAAQAAMLIAAWQIRVHTSKGL